MINLVFVLICLVVLLYGLVVNPVSVRYNPKLSVGADEEQLRTHVSFLTSVSPARSFENTNSLNQCADYISHHFEGLGFTPLRQHYTDEKYPFQNVVASYRPEEQKRVIIGAHYDVCGPFMGADDNASGIAGLLELAQLISKEQPNLDYGIDFVAYSTEEPPYFRGELMGSHVHAESVSSNRKNIKLMVVLEMIGYFSDEPNSQKYPIGLLGKIYPTTANFIALVGRANEFSAMRNFKTSFKAAGKIDVRSINSPVPFDGLDRSDHRNYWKFGMKAIMVTNTSFYRNTHYHTDSDTPETLNFHKMKEVVNGTYHALINLN